MLGSRRCNVCEALDMLNMLAGRATIDGADPLREYDEAGA
jgi:hypothetical protein